MPDTGVSPTGEGNGEEAPVRAFLVILVIALILTTALGIFRIRQNADVVNVKPRLQQGREQVIDGQDIQSNNSDVLGN